MIDALFAAFLCVAVLTACRILIPAYVELPTGLPSVAGYVWAIVVIVANFFEV